MQPRHLNGVRVHASHGGCAAALLETILLAGLGRRCLYLHAECPVMRSHDRRRVCFDQERVSIGATVTRSFTAWASCRSSVIKASAWSWVRATYSASNVSGHPSWSATFHATF